MIFHFLKIEIKTKYTKYNNSTTITPTGNSTQTSFFGTYDIENMPIKTS